MLIAQVTDMHIVARGSHWLSIPATDTAERLKKVINKINALVPKPDIVLFTGDNTEDGKRESYEHLLEILKPLAVPFFIIPGNHDNREEMRAAFPQMPYEGNFLQLAALNYPLGLIGLDTLIPGEDEGSLSRESITWLEEKLRENPHKDFLIFLHHFPVKVGQSYFDTIRFIPDEYFARVIAENANAIGLIAGHYHKPFSSSYAGKPCFIGHSSAPLYAFPNYQAMSGPKLELTPPAFTLYRWDEEKVLSAETVMVVDREDVVGL